MYKKTKDKIHQLLNEGIFPGINASFIKQNERESICLGYAQLIPQKIKLSSDMLFDVASLTKVICTTTVILQLVEESRIQLDIPMKNYYPTLKDEQVTVRHLLTHTSDIRTFIPNRDTLSKEELREAYTQVESGNKIGEDVLYTDTGTILLGFMLEEIFRKNLTDIFKERVLTPIGMTQSCFLPTTTQNIVPTENHPIRGLIHGVTHDPKAFVLAEHAGNAGLFTTLTDLEKFSLMYLNKGQSGGNRILREETIAQLLKDCTPNSNGNRSLGWALKSDLRTGNKLLFHTGYTGTFIMLDVKLKEAFLFLSNRVHPTDRREEYIKKRNELIAIYLQEK